MPSLSGVKFRGRLIWQALTLPFSRLVTHPVGEMSLPDFLAGLLPGVPMPPADLPGDPTALAHAGATVIESSERGVARTLYFLARTLQSQHVLEVGVYRGFTTAYLAAATAETGGTVHLADLSADALAIAAKTALLRHDRVKTYQGLSTDPTLIAKVPGPLDLIYLDADHSEDGVYAELEAWWPRVRIGGVIAIHDAINIAGICRTVNRWAAQHPVLTMATGRGSGLALFKKAI